MLHCGFIKFRKVPSHLYIFYDLFHSAVSSWDYATLSVELIVNNLPEETEENYEEPQPLWWMPGVWAEI
jgi:hypothetical protein